MINTSNGSLTAYVGFVVAVLAQFGWVANPADITTVVAGVVTFIGIVYQHYTTAKIAGMAKQAGATGIK